MPSPIAFGPKEPDSWRLSWMGHAGGSGDPARTSPNGPTPPPPPPAAPPTSSTPSQSGRVVDNRTLTTGPYAAWPNAFQNSTQPDYPAYFQTGPGAPPPV